jgi:signal transduction histidine kinase
MSRREWLAAVLVLAGLAGFVVTVFGVVVLGGGALVGRPSSSPAVALSVIATAVVALAFDRVQTRLEGVASRAVHGGHSSPYDVLRQFSGSLTGQYPAEELPSRMARVLADGTGAAWAQVWLAVGDRLTLAATWPPHATPDSPDAGALGRRSLSVRHNGELLGVLVVQEREHFPLTSVEADLFAGLARQAGLVLRGARLRAELESRAEELSRRADELRLSRQRLVDAQDAGRRSLERDIHDGAQQHLVALAVNLRLAQKLSATSRDRADRILATQEKAAAVAVDTLRQLSQGIYPHVLAGEGLVAALRVAVSNSPIPLELGAAGVDRYPASVEAAAYFCCLEAVQNAAKHSGAARIRLALRTEDDGSLVFAIVDDGAGFDPRTNQRGSGLENMWDRIEAVGGTLAVTSEPAAGTRIEGRIPLKQPI